MSRSTSLKLMASLGLGGASLVFGLPSLAPVWPAGRWMLGIADRLADADKVALTFDDGPSRDGTPRLLRFLARAEVKATFFLLGEQVALQPELAAEIVRQGHAVGLHGYGHHALTGMSNRELHEDLERARYTVASATQTEPVFYRPPRGVFTYQGLAAVRDRGLEPVLWTTSSRDWNRMATADSIYLRVTTRLRGREIILLHDSDEYLAAGSWLRSLDALPRIVEQLGERGLAPVPITSVQMLRRTPPTVGRRAPGV
jgi:peptidoglycan/xylan/chitin deacetylase (PgdA/CDA1 family)